MEGMVGFLLLKSLGMEVRDKEIRSPRECKETGLGLLSGESPT